MNLPKAKIGDVVIAHYNEEFISQGLVVGSDFYKKGETQRWTYELQFDFEKINDDEETGEIEHKFITVGEDQIIANLTTKETF